MGLRPFIRGQIVLLLMGPRPCFGLMGPRPFLDELRGLDTGPERSLGRIRLGQVSILL